LGRGHSQHANEEALRLIDTATPRPSSTTALGLRLLYEPGDGPLHLSSLSVRGFRGADDEEPLVVGIPGRFSVLIGANGSGKTTVCDAAVLAHGPAVFPRGVAVSAAALGRRPRSVKVAYSYEPQGLPEGPLGTMLQQQSGHQVPGGSAGEWERDLSRRLGLVSAGSPSQDALLEHLRFVYLPAWRNPLDELARREARVLIELLRAQQQRTDGTRNLKDLRGRATGLLDALTAHGLIAQVQERISEHLGALSAGVERHWPYVRVQVVDDNYLARVLELMLAVIEGSPNARPLEVSGLGYVNLLHIAVTLAAIPDYTAAEQDRTGEDDEQAGPPEDSAAAGDADAEEEHAEGDEAAEVLAALEEAADDAEAEEDSFFPTTPFHATVIIEEPEAHLHPQLQHSLVRYLRRITLARPELQVILSTHAPDILTSCRPEDLVVIRRGADGKRVARAIADLPLTDRDNVLRKTRLHMDATRSSALFAERVVLVEGVSDAALLREFAWAWAGADEDRQAFVDALSIVAIGNRIGPWPVQLLATRGAELCSKLALLADSDKDPGVEPTVPLWLSDHDRDIVDIFVSEPTLEPAVIAGNEALVEAALKDVGLEVTPGFDAVWVRALFRSRQAATEERDAIPAGAGAGRKAEFALALAEHIRDALDHDRDVRVPDHMTRLLDFLYPTASEPSAAETESPQTPTDATPAEE
jgi:putative ATP-dependent endonuclease of OLD family